VQVQLLVRDEIVKIAMKREHPAAQIVDVPEAHTDGYLPAQVSTTSCWRQMAVPF